MDLLVPNLKLAAAITCLIALTYNPFLFDFYVAARGYSIALAFLMMAIGVLAWCHKTYLDGGKPPWIQSYIVASLSLAVSFLANFSFAFVDTAALLLLLAWTLATPVRAGSGEHLVPGVGRLIAAVTVPGFVLTALFASWTLLTWPTGQLWDGAHSPAETIRSVVAASLYEPNRYLINPGLYPAVEYLKPVLIPAVLLLALLRLSSICLTSRISREIGGSWLPMFGLLVFAVALVSLVAHWLALLGWGLLMPMNRTAIYFAPLITLSVAAVAAACPKGKFAVVSRNALIGSLWVLATYFGFCMRLTYFREWQYGADVREVYSGLAPIFETNS